MPRKPNPVDPSAQPAKRLTSQGSATGAAEGTKPSSAEAPEGDSVKSERTATRYSVIGLEPSKSPRIPSPTISDTDMVVFITPDVQDDFAREGLLV